ncbi:hypothetical protein [Nocardia yamanashiensis]|uniref:hypothetical protein n=1 Tax=Nocardia yamanashiensis TaxID=209247 RepID=UPI0012FD55FE|nr:hypothetical protein [Nocardia yamanashiensis]
MPEVPSGAAGQVDIVAVVANVVRNIFTDYINEALAVDGEWPLVTPLTATPIPA